MNEIKRSHLKHNHKPINTVFNSVPYSVVLCGL
jgi:hypothetical protein